MNGAMDPGSRRSGKGGHGGSEGDGGESDIDAAERLRRALATVAAGNGSSEELQIAARALVNDLRKHDEPPEKVLLKIKAILGSVGLRSSYQRVDEELPEREAALYRDVIAWSIRAYYEDAERDAE